jgi:hypothetical protein
MASVHSEQKFLTFWYLQSADPDCYMHRTIALSVFLDLPTIPRSGVLPAVFPRVATSPAANVGGGAGFTFINTMILVQ